MFRKKKGGGQEITRNVMRKRENGLKMARERESVTVKRGEKGNSCLRRGGS